jgi:2-polyprenyl-3-methyl-5-hydroxy-6-metoxy-1,4-benzoquinol methylase
MTNENLKQFYNKIYSQGETSFFSKYVDGKNVSENDAMVLKAADWQGKTVLDAGCGTGRTAYLIANAGAKQVVGIDFSEEAIKVARRSFTANNLSYRCMELHNWKDNVDVIVSCGTLEHTDRPWNTLATMDKLLPPGGEIIITCPCFLNIRGFIWLALQILLNVPMSLTDVHFISPFDIEEWLKGTRLKLEHVMTFDYSKGNGSLMLTDLRKRLANALKDANLNNEKVGAFIDWLEKVVNYREESGAATLDGTTALYVIRRLSKR